MTEAEQDREINEMDLLNLDEDGKEKLKQKLNKDKIKDSIIDMFIKAATEWKSVEEKLQTSEDEKKALEQKLTDTLDDLMKKDGLLQEEQEYANNLASKLTSTPTQTPAVLLLSDTKVLFEKLSKENVSWEILVYETVKKCNSEIDGLRNEMNKYDLVVIMIGREEIINGGDGIKIISELNKITSKLETMDIPYRVSQILPVKGPKGRTEVNIVNRKILSTKAWTPMETFQTFQGVVEREIFKDKKICINEPLLSKVVTHFQQLVGTPDIRKKSTLSDSDPGEITEFVPLLKKHAGLIIGPLGETVQALQDKFSAQISIIDYTYKKSEKKGALITGPTSVRENMKSKMAEMIKEDDENQDDRNSKRGKSNNDMSWAKKLKAM